LIEVIAISFIGACAFFSYRSGFKEGVNAGVINAVNSLAQQRYIKVDDEGNISKAD